MGLSDYYEDREYVFEKRITDLETQLADARAEIEALRMGKMSPCDYYTSKESEESLCRELFERDKLIEQMREALKFSLIADEVRQTRNVCASDINDACETSRIKRIAALSAAERGKK